MAYIQKLASGTAVDLAPQALWPTAQPNNGLHTHPASFSGKTSPLRNNQMLIRLQAWSFSVLNASNCKVWFSSQHLVHLLHTCSSEPLPQARWALRLERSILAVTIK